MNIEIGLIKFPYINPTSRLNIQKLTLSQLAGSMPLHSFVLFYG